MAVAPIQRQRISCLVLLLILLTLLLVVGGGIAWVVYGGGIISSNPGGVGISTAPDGEPIGIRDGSYAFDTNRLDGDLKRQASGEFKSGDITGAESLWRQAIVKDTNDAEALIYLEDQQVRASGNPYITLIVGTMLTGGASDVGTGHDDLQGAYVAQREYNDGFKLGRNVQVLLLIANSGGQAEYATTVAQQIVQAAKQDQHIVGVMGWSFSAQALKAVDVLSKAHIPMVSPTAFSDSLTGISPFFFRVAPSNRGQAIAGAQYAEQQLHAKRAVLFVDPNNAYSNSLANDFKQQFAAANGNQIVATEQYTVEKPETLPPLLQAALTVNPDLIYFAGYADDMAVLLTDLSTSQPSLQLMGGDALYQPEGYPASARAGFERLHFTVFAYADEWDILGLGSQKPAFFTIYARDFDPDQVHIANPYGYLRPDSGAILSYDATFALLEGCKNALAGSKTSLTPRALQQSLVGINSSNPIQGVSGQIAFGPDGDPIKKAIVILAVNPQGYIQEESIQGCFLAGQCGS